MSTPFFTVYVPFHNEDYADMAQVALASLEEQDFQSFETILIANGTKIPTWALTPGFLSDTRAVFGRKIVAGAFHTLPAAANAALGLARGQWIIRLDADDQFVPDALAEYTRAIQRVVDNKKLGVNRNFAIAGHWDDTESFYGGGLVLPTTWLHVSGGYDEDEPLGDGRLILDKLQNQPTAIEPYVLRTSKKVYIYDRHSNSMSITG